MHSPTNYVKPPGPPTPPTQLKVDLVTAISITLTWQPGLDGGHPQIFQVRHRLSTMMSFFPRNHENTIADARQDLVMKYNVTELEPKTHYQFQVMATNRKGSKLSTIMNAVTLGK